MKQKHQNQQQNKKLQYNLDVSGFECPESANKANAVKILGPLAFLNYG